MTMYKKLTRVGCDYFFNNPNLYYSLQIDVVADEPDAVVARQLPDYSSTVGRFGFDINWQIGHRQPRQLFSDDKLVAIKRMEMIHITQVGEDKLLELDHPSIVKGFAAEQDERYKYKPNKHPLNLSQSIIVVSLYNNLGIMHWKCTKVHWTRFFLMMKTLSSIEDRYHLIKGSWPS